MILEVFDNNFHRYGVLNTFSMVQYELPAIGVGSFQINCDINKDNLDLLKSDRIIWFEDDIAGIIQYIENSNEQEKLMTLKGCLLSEMLSWRYIYPRIDMVAPMNKIIEKYVDNNCVNPQQENRKFNNFEIETSDFELETVSKEKTGGTINEAIQDLLESKTEDRMIHVNVGFYPREKKFKFYIKKGLDRTKGNAENNKNVLFSQDLKNIINSQYTYNNQEYRNTALVAGEENGATRTSVIVNDGEEHEGFFLREVFIDARDLQSEDYDENGNEKKLTPQEYNDKLIQRGNEKLGELIPVNSYSGDIRNDADVAFVFKKDYNLGDKVDVIDLELGLRLSAVVTSVTVTQDSNGYSVNPSFGYAQPTLIKKLRKRGVL